MRIMTNVLAAVLIAVVSVGAQQKPDFSGAWVLAQDRSSQTMKGSVVVSVSGLLGDKFSAVQDAKTLTLTITVAALGRDIKVAYNLDGSESKNLNPVAAASPTSRFFRARHGRARSSSSSREAPHSWMANRSKPKRVIWLEKDGLLTIERSAEGAPTLRSVYQRSK
jgi:hypothetical protein